MNKKFKSLFKDTLIFALGSLGSKVILFFLVPLYTNYLTTDEYGIADLVFSTAQLIIPIASIVIYESVIRFGLSKDQDPAEVLKVGIYIGVAGSIASILATPLLGLYLPIAPWKWYLCILIVLNFTSNILMSYLKVKDKNKRYAIISVTRTLIMAALNIVLLAFLHLGVKGYLIANIGASSLCVLFAAIAGNALNDLRSAHFNRNLFIEMVKYAAPLILNDLSWWVIHSSDKIMIEAMISASALGLYTVATKIPSLINVMISIFGQAWGISSIREIETTNDPSFYEKVLKGYMFITFSACVLLVSIIKPFMYIYVGKDFQTAWTFVPMLLVSAVFSSISSYYGQLYGALKKSINSMITTISAAIINIAVNYIFIQIIGIWGAVIGTVSAYIILALMRIIDVSRYVHINIDSRRLISNCVIIIIQGILVSLNFHIILVSLLSIVLFGALNYKTAKEFLLALFKNIKVIS